MTPNPIIELSLVCQKLYKSNIETFVIDKSGPDHEPVITVKIVLPNGKEYTASGKNKAEAKQAAAIEALKFNQIAHARTKTRT